MTDNNGMEKLQQLRDRSLEGGGEKRVHAQHERGKLTARERIDLLVDPGAPLLNESPNPGAHGCKIAFLHPKHLGGVLAELVEDPHA